VNQATEALEPPNVLVSGDAHGDRVQTSFDLARERTLELVQAGGQLGLVGCRQAPPDECEHEAIESRHLDEPRQPFRGEIAVVENVPHGSLTLEEAGSDIGRGDEFASFSTTRAFNGSTRRGLPRG